jgi:uncharacterized protein YqkB
VKLLELKGKTISTVEVISESKTWKTKAGVYRSFRVTFTDGTVLVLDTNCDICETAGCGHLKFNTERKVKREVIDTVSDPVEVE